MIDKLVDRIKKTGAPIVAGLDPTLKFVPEHVKRKAFAAYGETTKGAAEAIWQYNKEIIDHIYDLIPAVKPQIAMYEQFGVDGLIAFQKTVDYCKQKDLVVIGDIKRGDIGSTSEAYAVGHLGQVKVGSTMCRGFDEDFVTVNPYLGSDGVKPFIKVCQEEKKGIFVLVKTSNPSSGELQDRLVRAGTPAGGDAGLAGGAAGGDVGLAGGAAGSDAGLADGAAGSDSSLSGGAGVDRPLYEIVGEQVAAWGAECMGDSYSYVGAVVGATYPEQGRILRDIMPKAFILVPGYGAQGGKGADLVHFFNKDGLGAIINSSRGIIAAYQQEQYAAYGAQNFAEASRAAVLAMKEDIERALAGRL